MRAGRERPDTSATRPSRSSPSATPPQLPWGDLDIDVVIESTGIFTSRDAAAAAPERRGEARDHLRALRATPTRPS